MELLLLGFTAITLIASFKILQLSKQPNYEIREEPINGIPYFMIYRNNHFLERRTNLEAATLRVQELVALEAK